MENTLTKIIFIVIFQLLIFASSTIMRATVYGKILDTTQLESSKILGRFKNVIIFCSSWVFSLINQLLKTRKIRPNL